MATSSDGGDTYDPSIQSPSLSNGTTSGDLRFFLQSLLDDKEKQLQQAGTLGQQLLAQRMELDDTVRTLLETLDAGDGDEFRERRGLHGCAGFVPSFASGSEVGMVPGGLDWARRSSRFLDATPPSRP